MKTKNEINKLVAQYLEEPNEEPEIWIVKHSNSVKDIHSFLDKVAYMQKYGDSETKEFPNGFRSWMETHHEIVSAIDTVQNNYGGGSNSGNSVVIGICETQGTNGLYDHAEKLTDEFELKNEGREWDGEFYEEIEEFFQAKDRI